MKIKIKEWESFEKNQFVVTLLKSQKFRSITVCYWRCSWKLLIFAFSMKNKSPIVSSGAVVKESCSHKLLSLAPLPNCMHGWTNLFLTWTWRWLVNVGALCVSIRVHARLAFGDWEGLSSCECPRIDRGAIALSGIQHDLTTECTLIIFNQETNIKY